VGIRPGGIVSRVSASPVCTVVAPLLGTVASLRVAAGDVVGAGQELVVLESMKMEHPVAADVSGVVVHVLVHEGQTVEMGQELLRVEPREAPRPEADAGSVSEAPSERSDLARYHERRRLTGDAARPEAVAKRRARGQRTARENVADLCDPGSFQEYGAFAIAAQRDRRSLEDLTRNTPADGLVCGIGAVGGAACAVLAYDYTVLAGTQGFLNHRKKDRLFALATELRLPVVLFAEGGGGRPGDTDAPGVAGLDTMAFALFARHSGLAPSVGIASGYCFAGNAALLGCCDLIIATENSNIGMAGPAMIEGGGLGRVAPTSIGPIEVQTRNGVVDVRVADEAEAVAVARRYLAYFTRREEVAGSCAPVEGLRDLVPERRTRVYDVRAVMRALADRDSLLELRPAFGVGILTALARIEGRSLGLLANNPGHLGGAIDADAADKAARFVQLCDAYDLPIVSLCDTPGFMVGPEAEERAQVRHFGRMFVTAASSAVPWITVVLRKGYGLGAQAMAGGSFHAKALTISWPTGEFGGMGLEGAVRLGYRRELEAVADPGERQELEEKLVAAAYERGSALNMATHTEIDDVIDPAETRFRISAHLRSCPPPPARSGRKRSMIDPW
jgi:acetyl-CoA carboxylase carboxyltransferase component